MNDTRKEGRLPVTLLARYREPTMLEPREGECRDVSPGGMFIMTPRPSPRGALIRFECLADSPDEGFRGTGRVVWQRNKTDPRGPAGMGIRFVRLESGSREALQRIVERVQLERQRGRGEPGRRTSSGPPPRVRATEADTQPVPIFGATGDAAGRDPSSALRAATLRGPGGRGSDRSTERGPVQRSPLPPAQGAGSPLPPLGAPAGPLPNFGSTLISASPPPDQKAAEHASSAWPPRSPQPAEDSRSATPPPLGDPAPGASPLPPPSDAAQQRSDALRERLDRTRRGVGPSGAPGMERAPASGSPPARDARNAEAVTTAETRPISDKPAHPTLRSPGPLASDRPNERPNDRTLLGRPSDRPPRPGGVDDLRNPRTSVPPKAAGPAPTGVEAQTPSIAPEVVTMPSGQAAPAFRAPPIDAAIGSEGRNQVEHGPWTSGIGLPWVLASGVITAALVWKLFGGAPTPLTDDAIAKLASRFEAHAQTLSPEPPPAETRPSEEPTPPEAPSGKSAPDLEPPVSGSKTKPDDAKPAAPAEPKATREAPAAAPGEPTQARARGAGQARSVEPAAAKPAGGPPPEPAPVLTTLPQLPAPPPTPAPPAPPAATPTPGAPPKSPLDQALECLAHGDNACVIRVLEDKASSERELELLIATYRTVGSGARADATIKRYLEAYPNGQHAAEYQRLLERHGSGPQHL